MNEARWERLLEYLRRAWTSEQFEAKERLYRQQAAKDVQRILERAVTGESWVDRLGMLSGRRFADRAYDLTLRKHMRWLRPIAARKELGLALSCFQDPHRDAVERFSAFVQAVADARPELRESPVPQTKDDKGRDDDVLAIGSLFNFAAAPEQLPVIRAEVFDLLEQTLGFGWTFQISVVDQYARHLEFAADVEHRLRDAGIEVRDMVDVQALIQIAALEADFWCTDPQARGRPARGGRPAGVRAPETPYLSICAAYRDEAPNLREWIEFHRLVGVERFFLYDNLSEDEHLDVLAPYLEDGTVDLLRWPVVDPQLAAYHDCLRWHRYDSRWIAFIDVDEFLFSPTGRPLPEILADYEAWPGVAVPWTTFGGGGHRTRPAGPVIENYLRTVDHEDRVMNVKSIVDPTRVIRFLSCHHCAYPYMSAVDENFVPVVERHTLLPPSSARLKLNHYHFKSEEEYVAKFEAHRAIGRRRKLPPTPEELEQIRNDEEERGVPDEQILMYLPALREALAAREQASPVAAEQR